MDNIAHTAIGAIATEIIYHKFKKEDDPALRRNLHILSAVSSNLPDFDLLMQLIDPSNLGYLVNHRGHSHTVLGVFIQILMVFGLCFGLNRFFSKKTIEPAPAQLKLFFYVISFGLCSHLALDFMNSYGVHPFWPFDNSWYYGDFVFIIEPFIWITAGICFFHIRKNLPLKSIFLVFCLSSPIIFQIVGAGSYLSIFYIYVYSVLAFFYIKDSAAFKTSLKSLGLIASVISLFALQGFYAKNHLKTAFTKEAFKIIDLSTSPMPGNFFCWKFLTALSNSTEFITYSGTYSFSKHVLKTCPKINNISIDNASVDIIISERILLDNVYTQKISDLQSLSKKNCRTEAWFTYARFPFYLEDSLLDLRFTARSKKNFASFDLNVSDNCPVFKSPWTPPRLDILLSN